MKAYLVSNYRLAENLVDDIYQLKQAAWTMEAKDIAQGQLGAHLNDAPKFKSQLHKLASL